MYFLQASSAASHGHDPWQVHSYLYPATLALILEPFDSMSQRLLWQVWVGIIVGAAVLAVVLFARAVRDRLPAVWAPVVFLVVAFTILDSRYWPMSRELALGQTDTMILVLMVGAGLAAARATHRRSGTLVGLAGLLKGWPWATAVYLAQRGYTRRRLGVGPILVSIVAAVATSLIFGWSGLAAFGRNVFDARSQHLVGDSVWTTPQLLFAPTGLAHPLAVSLGLRLSVTAALVAWVVLLAYVSLTTTADRSLAFWQVTFCVILLLPVSHRQYALLALPVLWWWTVHAVRPPSRDWRQLTTTLVLWAWWIDQNFAWPYNGSSPAVSALRYSIPFAANLIACSASILAARAITVPLPNQSESPAADVSQRHQRERI